MEAEYLRRTLDRFHLWNQWSGFWNERLPKTG